MNSVLSFTQRRRKSVIGLTPLIDVVFILLLFFMLASNFQKKGGMQVAVPAESAPSVEPVDGLTIRIQSADVLWLDGVAYDVEELNVKLSELALTEVSLPVTVRSEEGVSVQLLVSVLDEVAQAGFNVVALD